MYMYKLDGLLVRKDFSITALAEQKYPYKLLR